MTMTTGGQLTFDAETPTDFRALLGKIVANSTLSCGQVAIKTGMPRSTAYSLIDTKRGGLPSNPGQVRAFVRACGLTSTQVDLVMDCWTKLQQEIEKNQPVAVEGTTTKEGVTPRGSSSRSTRIHPLIDVDLIDAVSQYTSCNPAYDTSSGVRAVLGQSWGKATTMQQTRWPDLLHFVLADEARTRRAVLLLLPVTVLLLGLMLALVFLAIKVPAVAPIIAVGLALPFLLHALHLRKRGRGAKVKT
ncbi:hypothetical protein L3Q67_45460 (plasmid) [Saccharothrix sp. AJ9571]|nr:hypothetical protein L3Q67_45460 [Saccharothrix sp. AJ9571]